MRTTIPKPIRYALTGINLSTPNGKYAIMRKDKKRSKRIKIFDRAEPLDPKLELQARYF